MWYLLIRVADRVCRIAEELDRRNRRKASRNLLAKMTARELKDIGLTPDDAWREVRNPRKKIEK